MYQSLSANRKHCLQHYHIEFANRGKYHLQEMLRGIKEKQRKLQEAHKRSKTVTHTGETA